MQERSIEKLLDGSSIVVGFRHIRMTPSLAQKVIAEARKNTSKPFDAIGAALGGGGSQFLSQKAAVSFQDKSGFYCSELVAQAYAKAGLPLTGVGAEANTPRSMAKTGDLRYIGHMKI